MDTSGVMQSILTDARLLRNEADYDLYPNSDQAWRSDAISLSTTAIQFVSDCQSFASTQGLI